MRRIFIDGGARMGESLEILQKDMPQYMDCDFIFYEPNPKYIPNLVEICEKNKNYSYIEGAIWNKNSESDFYIAIDGWGDVGSTLHTEKQEKLDRENPLKVKTYDICDILNQFTDEDYVILKLDVEGSEYDIAERLLDSGKISKIKECLIEWHDHFYQGKDRWKLIEKLQQVTNYKDWTY